LCNCRRTVLLWGEEAGPARCRDTTQRRVGRIAATSSPPVRISTGKADQLDAVRDERSDTLTVASLLLAVSTSRISKGLRGPSAASWASGGSRGPKQQTVVALGTSSDHGGEGPQGEQQATSFRAPASRRWGDGGHRPVLFRARTHIIREQHVKGAGPLTVSRLGRDWSPTPVTTTAHGRCRLGEMG